MNLLVSVSELMLSLNVKKKIAAKVLNSPLDIFSLTRIVSDACAECFFQDVFNLFNL